MLFRGFVCGFFDLLTYFGFARLLNVGCLRVVWCVLIVYYDVIIHFLRYYFELFIDWLVGGCLWLLLVCCVCVPFG